MKSIQPQLKCLLLLMLLATAVKNQEPIPNAPQEPGKDDPPKNGPGRIVNNGGIVNA